MRWSVIRAFTIKDLKLGFRSKEALFWIFVWPIILILMTGYIFIPPAAGGPLTLDIGVVNHDLDSAYPMNGSLFLHILEIAEYNGTRLFNVRKYENETLMAKDVKAGLLDGGVNIPEGFGRNLILGQAGLEIYVGVRDVQTAQITEAVLRMFIHEMNRAMLEMKGIYVPINASFIDVKPKIFQTRSSIIGWYTIGAVGMVILYGGLNYGSLMILEERARRTLRRLLSSPMSAADMMVGKTISSVLILSLSAVTSIVFGIFFCEAKILWNPYKLEDWVIPLLMFSVTLMTIGLGMLLALITKSARAASSLSTILGLMLSFTAGIWFPKTWMPIWLRILADIFPVTWAMDIVRDIMVYEAGIIRVAPGLLRVLIATAVIYMIGVISYRKTLRRYAET